MFQEGKKLFSYNKEKYDNFLDDTTNPLSKVVNKIISLFLIIFVFILVLESVESIHSVFARQFFLVDSCISVIFILEYLYRFLKTPNKWYFLVKPIRIIDLLSFLPFILSFFITWNLLKILRLLRVLRIIRFVRNIPLTSAFIKALRDYIDEYRAVFILFMIVLFLGSFLVYYVEKDLPGTKFTSIPISLWWGIVTMTTVWFGDIYPVTPLGKLFWSMIVFLWPLLLALGSAVTIMVFMETTEKQQTLWAYKKWKICLKCHSRNVKKANYCFVCGKKFSVHTLKIKNTHYSE